MAMVKWDPLQELKAMREQMDRIFELSRDRSGEEPFEKGLWQPPADIYEDDLEVVVAMEVPEIDQRDIQVQIEENLLIIRGERKLERAETKQNYHRIERSYGHFRRSFSLPASVDQNRIAASCRMGVLRIVLPKKAGTTRRQIDVEVESDQG